jgi:hypothetical protein
MFVTRFVNTLIELLHDFQQNRISAAKSTATEWQQKHKTRCTYNVTLESISETLVAVENSTFLCVCWRACNLAYPACKAQAPFSIVICNLSGSAIFLDIIPQTAWFSEKSHWTQNVSFDFL